MRFVDAANTYINRDSGFENTFGAYAKNALGNYPGCVGTQYIFYFYIIPTEIIGFARLLSSHFRAFFCHL